MFCGLSSRAQVEDDAVFSRPRSLSSSSSSSSKSKRRDTNPYSNRGLDKFASLVADLEAKKEKIMQKVAARESNPDDVFLVRFTHSPSHEGWIPIVIGKKKKPQKKAQEGPPKAPDSKQAFPAAVSSAHEIMNAKKKRVDGQRRRRRTWNSYYWPLVLILILVCLVMFGRSFAILCTSIWWYLVPVISKEHGIERMDDTLIKNMGGDLKAHHQLKVRSPPRHHLHHHHMHGRK